MTVVMVLVLMVVAMFVAFVVLAFSMRWRHPIPMRRSGRVIDHRRRCRVVMPRTRVHMVGRRRMHAIYGSARHVNTDGNSHVASVRTCANGCGNQAQYGYAVLGPSTYLAQSEDHATGSFPCCHSTYNAAAPLMDVMQRVKACIHAHEMQHPQSPSLIAMRPTISRI